MLPVCLDGLMVFAAWLMLWRRPTPRLSPVQARRRHSWNSWRRECCIRDRANVRVFEEITTDNPFLTSNPSNMQCLAKGGLEHPGDGRGSAAHGRQARPGSPYEAPAARLCLFWFEQVDV